MCWDNWQPSQMCQESRQPDHRRSCKQTEDQTNNWFTSSFSSSFSFSCPVLSTVLHPCHILVVIFVIDSSHGKVQVEPRCLMLLCYQSVVRCCCTTSLCPGRHVILHHRCCLCPTFGGGIIGNVPPLPIAKHDALSSSSDPLSSLPESPPPLRSSSNSSPSLPLCCHCYCPPHPRFIWLTVVCWADGVGHHQCCHCQSKSHCHFLLPTLPIRGE